MGKHQIKDRHQELSQPNLILLFCFVSFFVWRNVEQIFRSIILTINRKFLVFFLIMLMLRLQQEKIYYLIDGWDSIDGNTWYPPSV